MSSFLASLETAEAADADRFGPKAARQAEMALAGLPTPGGVALGAEAYRRQLEHIGVTEAARSVSGKDRFEARNLISEVRIALFDGEIAPDIADPLFEAWHRMRAETGARMAVRSSALAEDRAGSNFAGQFESFLGLEEDADLLTAVRACWAAAWSSRALGYMESHGIDPAATGMGVIVQPLIEAKVSGGGMSRTAAGGMEITAAWGLGTGIAQGEVVPDRYVLSADGRLTESSIGRKAHSTGCRTHHGGPHARLLSRGGPEQRCLSDAHAEELGGLLKRSENLVDGPAEIEWVLDDAGFKLVQVRPLTVETPAVPDEIWLKKPGIRGHASGIGWGAGRACVVTCECELGRVAPGDVLVTKVAGPALAQVLPRVSGVVAELGGSTSHLASLARERGIPMVLGLLDATGKIPDGAQVGVDGVTGVVRWMS